MAPDGAPVADEGAFPASRSDPLGQPAFQPVAQAEFPVGRCQSLVHGREEFAEFALSLGFGAANGSEAALAASLVVPAQVNGEFPVAGAALTAAAFPGQPSVFAEGPADAAKEIDFVAVDFGDLAVAGD